MPPTAEGRAARLHAALAALPLEVDAVRVAVATAPLPAYPDGARPTSVVTLSGGGAAGAGEHVGWTAEAHRRFAVRAARVPYGATTVAAFAATLADAPPYDRAALEAAAVELALRQAGTTAAVLLGVAPAPVRYVASFAAVPDPLPAIRAEPAHVELKLDVSPAWPEAVWAALVARGGVAVLDWKGGGDAVGHAEAHRRLPEALHEDPDPGAAPWTAPFRRRLAADQPLDAAAALDALRVPPVAVNVKPARTGGLLEALLLAARAEACGMAVYLGGMWEVGIGRRQLRTLAALLAPDGPNDVAPIATAAGPAPRPARLVAVLDAPGLACEEDA